MLVNIVYIPDSMARCTTQHGITVEQKLMSMNAEVIKIDPDGHCLVNAVQTVLAHHDFDISCAGKF